MWKPIILQKMVKGDRVCGVLLEYQKIQYRAILTAHYGTQMMQVMAQATNEIKDRGGYLLRSALARAAKSDSRLMLTLGAKARYARIQG